MSMLSSQRDELRVLADELRQIADGNADLSHDEHVSLTASADAMRQAADTIWELRNRLVDMHVKPAGEYVYATDGHEGHWLTGEEIVRCRDCRYYTKDPDPIDPGWPMMCERTGDDMLWPNGFCAWALRKEDGDGDARNR